MQKALTKFANIIWLSLIALIILSGTLVGIARLASPYLKDFKSDIEAEVSHLAGSKVNIGKINARWKGIGPRLILHDIQINHPDQKTEPLRLNRIDLDLSLMAIIQSGKLLPWNVVLHGIELKLRRDADGKIQVTGLSGRDGTVSDEKTFSAAPLFQMPRLELRDTIIDWTDKTGKTPSTEFTQINLLLKNDADRHQLDLSFNLPGEQLQTLQVAADITASHENLASWSGDVFIKTRNLNVTEWLKSLMPKPFELLQGRTDTDVWISAENGEINSIAGNTAWHNVNLRRADQNRAFSLDSISSDFKLNKNQDDWRLELARFQLKSETIAWPETRLSYHRNSQQNTFFSVDHIDTRLWQPLADIFLPAKEFNIPALNLDGIVKNLHAFWKHDLSAWYAEGLLSGVTVLPDSRDAENKKGPHYPGVKNLHASFQFSNTKGLLAIDSQNSSYIHPGLFRDAIELENIKGNLSWEKTPENVLRISTDALSADTPDLSTVTRLLIEIPEDGKTLVDIQTDFQDGNALNASLYYPVGILGETLTEWMDNSIISGHVTSGSFILKGPLEDFPYSKTHNGHFEVLFNVEDTILDYVSDWPRLEEIAAQVRFHNNSLNIDVVSAKILDSELTRTVAHIDSLDPLTPIRITGSIFGPASDNLRILSETPLKEDFSQIASSLSITGETRLKLDFQIPLENIGKHKLDGSLLFQKNNLRLKDSPVKLDKVTGRLNFDLDGLDSKGLQARFLNTPVDIKISHDASSTTHIKSQLELHTDKIKELVNALPTEFISGKTLWNLDLQVPPVSLQKTRPSTLKLSSELNGVAINIPAPFTKTASEKRPLSVNVSLQPGSEIPLTLEYGKTVHASLLLDADQQGNPTLKSGQLYFGKAPVPTLKKNTFSLTGQLDSINLDDWLSWTGNLASNGQQPLALNIDLQSSTVNYAGMKLEDFKLLAKSGKGGITGSVASKQLNGKFQVPDYKKFDQLIVKLDDAAVTFDPEKFNEGTPEPVKKDSLNPADVPGLDIEVKKLTVNGHDFGNLLLKSWQITEGLHFDTFDLESEILDFHASGKWSNFASQQRTSIDFKLDSSDFGKVLDQLGFTPQIANGKVNYEGKLHWTGSPEAINKQTLSGDLNLNLEKGRFIDIEPGVGRVLGILNIAALQRRLTLDFSDLFREGFTFDHISAAFSIDNGDAYTNDLLIKSPSATINLSGRTGLYARDFDQLVTVTPSLQSTITLAGAVAGGPAGAAVAYLAQKLIGKQVDKIGRTRYTITGPWENPEITKIETTKPADEANNNDYSNL